MKQSAHSCTVKHPGGGQARPEGGLGFWQSAVLLPLVDTYVPGAPYAPQEAAFAILSRFGHLLGYRPEPPRSLPGA